MTPEELAEVATGLDAATREKWAREGFRLIALRGERFGEFLRAVRELMATLPKCDFVLSYGGGPQRWPTVTCDKPATRYDEPWGDTGKGREPREHYCDEHGAAFTDELDYAPALRKLQAMLDPEETEKP